MNEPAKVSFSREATIDYGPAGGRLERLVRRLFRWPERRRIQSLFQRDEVAFRFETDDGRVAIVPMDRPEYERLGHDRAQAEAYRLAQPALAELRP